MRGSNSWRVRHRLALLGAAASLAHCTLPFGGEPSAAEQQPVTGEHGRRTVQVPWVHAVSERPELAAFITARAAEARAADLTPIVHILTPWNSASTLPKHRDDEAVKRALHGIFVIEVDVGSLRGPETGSWQVQRMICGNYAQTFYAITPEGEPGLPAATPWSKDGPWTAPENARFLEIYVKRLRDEPVQQLNINEDRGWCDRSVIPASVWADAAQRSVPSR